jgi:O-antigen/teichoic acid export membrane protein
LRRKFLLNLFFLLTINLLIKPFWFFGVEVTVQNTVGNSEYGIYFTLFSFSLLFSIMLDLGINNFNNREIAKNKILLGKYFSNILGIKILLGFVYFIVCFILGIIWGYSGRYFTILSLLVFNQFLASFVLYLRSNINGLLLFISDSILSVLDKIVMILICSFLLWNPYFKNDFKIEWFIYAQTISYVLTAIVAWLILNQKIASFSIRFDSRYFVHIIKRSIAFSLLALLMQLYSRLEPILLEKLIPDGKVQAGLYAQAYRMIDVFLNFLFLFTVLLLPLFSKVLSKKEDINPLVKLGSKMMFVPAILLVSVCVVYNREIMTLMYHNESSANVLKIVIMGFIGFTSTLVFGTLLTANNNLKQLNIIAASSIVVNISLNLLLIPHFKAVGAAWSSFITQSLSGLIQAFVAYRILNLKFKRSNIFMFIAWSIILIAFGLTTQHFLPWKIGILTLIAGGTILAISMGLLNVKELYSIALERSEIEDNKMTNLNT